MKGYRDNDITVIEQDLKRCRELKGLIENEKERIKIVVDTYIKLNGNHFTEPYIADESTLDGYINERNILINKYLTEIVHLNQRERAILLDYYIDCTCIKTIAKKLRCNERQVVYAKKQALIRLANRG